MAVEEPSEVGAIEAGETRGFRDGSGTLHQVHEVTALEFRRRLTLRLGERRNWFARFPRSALTNRRVVSPPSFAARTHFAAREHFVDLAL